MYCLATTASWAEGDYARVRYRSEYRSTGLYVNFDKKDNIRSLRLTEPGLIEPSISVLLPYQGIRRLGSREQVLDGEQDDAQWEWGGPDKYSSNQINQECPNIWRHRVRSTTKTQDLSLTICPSCSRECRGRWGPSARTRSDATPSRWTAPATMANLNDGGNECAFSDCEFWIFSSQIANHTAIYFCATFIRR